MTAKITSMTQKVRYTLSSVVELSITVLGTFKQMIKKKITSYGYDVIPND